MDRLLSDVLKPDTVSFFAITMKKTDEGYEAGYYYSNILEVDTLLNLAYDEITIAGK